MFDKEFHEWWKKCEEGEHFRSVQDIAKEAWDAAVEVTKKNYPTAPLDDDFESWMDNS